MLLRRVALRSWLARARVQAPGQLGPDRKTVRYEISVSGGPSITAGHIHAGAEGANGPVLYPFTLLAPGAKGTQAVSAGDVTALDSAGLYVNFHSAANPGGETRGQMMER